ncbi:reverse transcriptase domain-containing protein [Tanacetum coccineum]|uniref:Reverse transcriptase domain-containing protein n=1 Tax=Tanacetum coccineum TaxID=301880 RepID=A0ABQ5AZQ1_9ASTR
MGKQLPEHFKERLQNLLRTNADVSAWTHADMTGSLEPLRLKITGGTYQRLVDKVFNDQIGRNLEAYVDDMVIKSTSEEDMLTDIKETFQSFDRKHKRNCIRKKGRRTGSHLLCKQSLTGSRAQLPCTGKTHTSIGTRSKKAAKILLSIYAKWAIRLGEHDIMFQARGNNNKEKPKDFLIETPPEDNRKEVGRKTDAKLEETKPSCEWKLYTDGASSSDGSGAGLMLIDPEEGIYAAKQPAIREYLQRTKETLRRFRSYTMEHIKRNQNKKADALSKLASMTFEHLTKEVLVEVLARRSIEEKEVLQVETKEEESWMTLIHEYLLSGLLSEDSKESRKIRIKAPQYKLIRGNLYKKSFYPPWLRCIALPNGGSCGFNMELRLMVVRITKQGYYWLSMHRDIARIIQDCEKCKEQYAARKRAEIGAIAAGNAWPFSHWGVNILEPLPTALRGLKFLAIAIEHSMK